MSSRPSTPRYRAHDRLPHQIVDRCQPVKGSPPRRGSVAEHRWLLVSKKGKGEGSVAIKLGAAGRHVTSIVMNTLTDSQLVLIGVLALGLLGLLIPLLRKAGAVGSLLLTCGGSVVVLLHGAHVLGSGSAAKTNSAHNLGEPAARVWVDTHTGIYYCAGTKLYGRTPGGRYMMQHVAQGELFSPAYKKPCL